MRAYILSLSDNALIRFEVTIWRKLNQGEYNPFGITWRYAKEFFPQLSQALILIREERNLRGI